MATAPQQQQQQQQQQKALKASLALTAPELEQLTQLTEREGWRRFTAEDLAMIAEDFPDGTTSLVLPREYRLADFKRFIRLCSAKSLDPLLDDIHWEYRSDKNSPTGMKGRPIIHQQAELKLAHRTGLLDGIEPSDGQDERGVFVQTCVYKKGCSRPFVFKAYFNEFKSSGYTWGTMGYNMLAKCSRVGALRIAFPDELAGLFIPEEPSPSPPSVSALPDNGNWTSGTSAPKLQVGEKPAPEPPIQPSAQVVKALEESAATDPKKLAADQYKQRLNVIVKGAFGQAGVAKSHVDEFLVGYFHAENLPGLTKIAPQLFAPALDQLIAYLASGPAAVEAVKSQARTVGLRLNPDAALKPLKTETEATEFAERYKWAPEICLIAERVMRKWQFPNVANFAAVFLEPSGLLAMTEEQIRIGLLLAYYEPSVCQAVLNNYKQTKMPLNWFERFINKNLGKALDSFEASPEKVMEAVNEAIRATGVSP